MFRLSYMCICMYVYVYVCIYIYIYIYLYTYITHIVRSNTCIYYLPLFVLSILDDEIAPEEARGGGAEPNLITYRRHYHKQQYIYIYIYISLLLLIIIIVTTAPRRARASGAPPGCTPWACCRRYAQSPF